jgi:hypothetical protein
MSFLATSSVLLYFVYNMAAEILSKRNIPRFKAEGYFWLVNLFVASLYHSLTSFILDIIQSIGWILPSYHLAKHSVVPSLGCNVQGVFINSGDIGSALFSFVIAIHTYLFFEQNGRWRTWVQEYSSRGFGRWVLGGFLWFMVAFLAFIGIVLIEKLNPDMGPFCAPLSAIRLIVDDATPEAWCWIAQNYPFERGFFHYCISISLKADGSIRVYQHHCTDNCVRHALFQMVPRTTL